MKRPSIDVVVPIHNAYEELDACLASVRKHGGSHRLILIDDASTDERVRALFRRLSAERLANRVLMRNERRMGFVETVNRGMALGSNDVLLLDSDTLLTRGCVDKMRRCAASDASIGTITAFSNEAGICSFPEFGRNNPVPDDPDLIGRAIELAAVPLYPELPTAAPFCMFIRRRLIRAIGVFDPAFRGGHGEAIDFSMRARNAGFRNVLCDDAYVVHVGSRAFAGDPRPVVEHGLAEIQAKHHDYLPLVRKFIANDPLRPIRGMIRSQLALLGNEGKPGVLHVVHACGGGTEKYIKELISASRDDYRHYFLRILPDRWLLTEADDAEPAYYAWSRDGDGSNSDWLRPICSWLRIEAVHVHSLAGSGDDLLKILDEAALPYCYSVHDMYLPCPTVYLINSEGEYCNATTDSTLCRQCLAKCSGLADIDIDRWRARYRALFRQGEQGLRAFEMGGGHAGKILPGHQGDRRAAPDRTLARRAGARSAQCVPFAGRRMPPDRGARCDRAREGCEATGCVCRQDPGTTASASDCRRRLYGLRGQASIERLRADHPWPVPARRHRGAVRLLQDRTGCLPDGLAGDVQLYPQRSWMAGRPALVPPRGALLERVLATDAGWIMDGWPDADSILDQLCALTAPENGAELERKSQSCEGRLPEGAAR